MDNIIRGANWYFDALNMWKVLDEVRMPEFSRSVEAFGSVANNWDVEFPEHFEAMSATIKLKNSDPQIRSLAGREPGNYITAYYYERLTDYQSGVSRGRIVVLKGLINKIADDPKQKMKATGVEYTFGTIVKYHDMFDGRTVHKLDYFAGPGATVVDGVSVFADMARLLAI